MDAERKPQGKGWAATRRRAGCVLGCLTEPLVIIWLMLGSALAGWLWRWRRDERRAQSAPPPQESDD
jgi:hypothetical protein